ATSSMDWCEENYIVSFYIAEWWNTLTNLNYMVLALIGLWSARKTKSELRCYLPYIGLFVIGVGSWLFHMTLTRQLQLSDELPMIWGMTLYVYCLWNVFGGRDIPSLVILAIYSIGTSIYYTITFNFHIFAAAFGVLVLVVGILPIYQIWKLSKTNPGHTRELAIILTVAISGYLIAFGFWNTDNLACDQLRELRGKIGILSVFLQFHGWWHMWTGLSAYCLYLLANYMRLITQGNKDVYVKW
ncbi:ceramidase, partial [Globomyces pollinis-pini]